MRLALEPHYLRRLVGIFGTILAVYVVFLAFLVLAQRQLMYFPNYPDSTPFSPIASKLDGFSTLAYTASDGTKLHGFFAPPISGRKLTIVFYQGNAGSLALRADKIRMWRDQGFGVMLATYRGYEGNEGSPTEQGLYQDARMAIEAAKSRGVDISQMVLYGESLGSGIAVEMAAEMSSLTPPAGLVLEVPYTSIPEVGAYRYPFVPIFWMLWDRYESINKVQNIHAPTLVLQAGKDKVIPPMFAKKLFDALPAPKKILTNINASHTTIYASPDIVKEIFAFMNGLEKKPAVSVAPVIAPPVVVPAPAVQQQPTAPSKKHKKR
jgi:uncharacterized protein